MNKNIIISRKKILKAPYFLIAMVLFSQNLMAQNIFEKHYGTITYDQPFNFFEEPNGEIVMSGRTNSAQGACLIKTNQYGDSLWMKTYNIDTFPITMSMFYRALKTPTGYLACGYFKSGNPIYWINGHDVYLIKTDSNGDTLFTHVFQTPSIIDVAMDMITDSSGSIYLAIMVDIYPSHFVRLMKTDSVGNQIFIKDYTDVGIHAPLKIIHTDSSNFILLCESHNTYMGVDYYMPWLVKIDSNGDILWTKHYAFSRGGVEIWDLLYENGNYYLLINPITGIDPLNIPNTDVNLLTLDSAGNIITSWTYHWDDKSWPMSMYKTSDGFLLTGYGQTMQNSVLTKIDNNGNTIWTCYRPQTYFNDVKVTSDGNITVCGMTNRSGFSYDSSGDFYLSKADTNCTVEVMENNLNNAFAVYPNPFNSEISFNLQRQNIKDVTIEIKNILGQTVFSIRENNLKSNYSINLNFLPKGIYLLSVMIDGKKFNRKIMKD